MKLKEKIQNASISMRQFYKLGIICFLVVAVASIYTGYATWDILDLGSKVSTIFRTIFNFGIVLFFNYLYKSLPPKEKQDNNFDIDKIIDEANL